MKGKGMLSVLAVILISMILVSTAGNMTVPASSRGLSEVEEELVKQKAISISMALYSGCSDYIIKESSEKASKQAIEAMRGLRGIILEKLEMPGFSVNSDGTVALEIQIFENPYNTAVFHNMIFKKINGKWILYSFEADV